MRYIVYRSRKKCSFYPEVIIVQEYAEDMMLRDLHGMTLKDKNRWRRTVVDGKWVCFSQSGIDIGWTRVCGKRVLRSL